jgi:large subunit ribosomal protein L17
MAKALLTNSRITTTEAKAKTLRGVVEPLITLALKNDVHARRQAYRVLGEHKLVQRLFDDIGPLFKDGGGGYTRVVKLALPRKGDAAPLAIIELVRKPEAAPESGAKAEKKTDEE